MRTKTPYWFVCPLEHLAASIYMALKPCYSPAIREVLDHELRKHCRTTIERHYVIWPLSLNPVLFVPAKCDPLRRAHSLDEVYLLQKIGVWDTRLTFARYQGYDDEDEFCRWINRQFRKTAWIVAWKTRPRM